MLRKTVWLSAVITLVLTAYLVAVLVSEQTNTLFLNGRWHSSKLDLERPVVGAVAFFTTHNALVSNKLNLESWHAYNEVLSKDSFQMTDLQLSFSVAEKADLSVQFSRDEHGYKAIRISPLPEYGVSYIEVDKDGLIKRNQKFSDSFKALDKNLLQIKFNQEAIEFFINQRKIGSVENLESRTGKVGFRSQAGMTWVDDILIRLQGGAEFKENFSNPRFKNYYSESLCTLIILSIVFFYNFKLTEKSFFIHQLMYINLIAFLLLLVLADRYYFQKQYSAAGTKLGNWMLGISKEQFTDVVENDDQVLRNVTEKLKHQEKASHIVALLGSSQTWGAGARFKNKSLEDFFEMQVQEKYKNKISNKGVTTINLGVPGARVHLMIRNLSQVLDSRIKQVVLIAGHNDSSNFRFAADLERLWVLTQKYGIKLHLVKEADYHHDMTPHLSKNHQTLQEFAEKRKLKIFDLHSYMIEKSQTGFMWWDIVHMTELGQKHMAEGLATVLD